MSVRRPGFVFLYTALFGVLPDIIQRGVHLSTVLLLVYVKFFGDAAAEGGGFLTYFPEIKFILFGLLAAFGAGYQFIYYDEVVARYGRSQLLRYRSRLSRLSFT